MNSCMITKLHWIVALLLLLLFVSMEAFGQHRATYPHPPQAADTATIENGQPQPFQRTPLNPAHLLQEVQELSSLTQELNQDIDAVNRGLLPKDIVNKLKRMEKLVKRMRKEIAP
jgi:CBS-domain-containing membrane protein